MMPKFNETDLMLLARTIYGEARGELNQVDGGMQSLQAVAWVIKNRAAQRRQSIQNVCLQPWQFSCWNHQDSNRCKLLNVTLDDKVFQACFLAATQVLFETTYDCTFGANHYHSTQINPPDWAKGARPTAKIAHHIFYKLG